MLAGMPARTVRRATSDDVPALVALRAHMFIEMGTSVTDDGWRASAREWFAARIEDPAYCFIAVEVAGDVVSSAIGFRRDTPPSPGNPTGGDVHVNNVCTLPEHTGRGHASAALAEVMAWARTTGTARAELMSTSSGRAIYERAGFVLHDYPAMRAPLQPREQD